MKTDREILELAARAAGIQQTTGGMRSDLGLLLDIRPPKNGGAECVVWNPLKNDGDALRLAKKLFLEIDIAPTGTAVRHASGIKVLDRDTCRAIVLCAAETARMPVG